MKTLFSLRAIWIILAALILAAGCKNNSTNNVPKPADQLDVEAFKTAGKLCHEKVDLRKGEMSNLNVTKNQACITCLESLTNKENKETAAYFSAYLGEMYFKGLGIAKSVPASEYWFYKAALLGNQQGMGATASFLMSKERLEEACVWAELAFAYNEDDDITFTDTVAQQYPADDSLLQPVNVIRNACAPLPSLTTANIYQTVLQYSPMTPQEANEKLKELNVTVYKGIPSHKCVTKDNSGTHVDCPGE